MLRFILSLTIFLFLTACENISSIKPTPQVSTTSVSSQKFSCGILNTNNIKLVNMAVPIWTIPLRKPGPITNFSDMKGVVVSFPMKVDEKGNATIRRIILERIQYVEKSNGELAVAAIGGQRDDGKIIDASNLAQGRKINTPSDLVGVKVFDRSLSESGLLVIKDIAFATRADGLLIFTKQSFVNEAGKFFHFTSELDNLFSCPKTFVNVCACPKFLGYCDDDNYPNCATETCNFGNATCEAKVEINCPGFCARDGIPGFCSSLPLIDGCGCIVIKTPDEM